MSDFAPTYGMLHVARVQKTTIAQYNAVRFLIQLAFAFWCTALTIIDRANVSSAALYVCILSALQLITVNVPVINSACRLARINRKRYFLLVIYAIDFFLQAAAVIVTLGAASSVDAWPVALRVYASFLTMSWCYATVGYNWLFVYFFSLRNIVSVQAAIDREEEMAAEEIQRQPATIDDLARTVLSSMVNLPDEMEDCAICSDLIEDGQQIRQLPCEHHYHQECIDEWFRAHRDCPLCRRRPSSFPAPQLTTERAPPARKKPKKQSKRVRRVRRIVRHARTTTAATRSGATAAAGGDAERDAER